MRRPQDCLDCGLDTWAAGEYYMVPDELWEHVFDGDASGMLCVGCFEQRLGRELMPADFTSAPCNFVFGKSWLLITRQFPEFVPKLGRVGMADVNPMPDPIVLAIQGTRCRQVSR